MENVLERLPSGARAGVIRLRSLGDCVLTTPAIALLKQTRPDLEIGVVVEDAFAPVFAGNPDISRIFPPAAGELASWHPALTLNLHGGSRSVALTLAARSEFRAGFAHFRYRAAYNIRIPRTQEILQADRKVHTAEHLASAMFFLGVPICEIPQARLFAASRSRSNPYAVIHPMAAAPDKTWPAAGFLAVAEQIEKRLGLDVVFVAGPGESLSEFAAYECMAGAPLEVLKSLLAGAALFVGNDSGPAHIAAAFSVPVVVLFGSSDPEIWRPWRTESVVLTGETGIASIPVETVFGAIHSLARLPQ